ncbi:cytochrome P450 [Saccharopolyspora pogona]|uniref:cytochrome P450 n=1 Tax=Saccharopolyspora pogona TaxID=333966 RepID=UPI000005346A|nr:cytochrome P450 [Saccharopolyspora pogona]
MTNGDEPMAYPFGEIDRLLLDDRYAVLREGEPVSKIRLPYGGDGWLVTRYADIKTVLGDPRFSAAAILNRDVPRGFPLILREHSLGTMDPPEHTRLRKLVGKAFTARRVEQLRPRTQQLVDHLLDRMAADGPPGDLVSALALPLPIKVICDLLGIPVADRERFRVWSDIALAITSNSPEEIRESRDQIRAYIGELVQQRKKMPTEDLLSVLVQARAEGAQLSEEEIVVTGAGLLIAGFETTANHIANFTFNLLTHPDQLDKLIADPELVPRAVEELLRYTPLGATPGFPRIATEDLELGGVSIRRGDAVFFEIASANRDSAVFDGPDELDLAREHNSHMALGHGPHYCIGAQLARMELQVAIGTLIKRFPQLSFAVPVDEVVWKRGRMTRGPEALPITW